MSDVYHRLKYIYAYAYAYAYCVYDVYVLFSLKNALELEYQEVQLAIGSENLVFPVTSEPYFNKC